MTPVEIKWSHTKINKAYACVICNVFQITTLLIRVKYLRNLPNIFPAYVNSSSFSWKTTLNFGCHTALNVQIEVYLRQILKWSFNSMNWTHRTMVFHENTSIINILSHGTFDCYVWELF